MPYRDENGKITIDEVAAAKDVKNLETAKEEYETAKGMLDQIKAYASEFSGNTGIVIMETADQLSSQIQLVIDATNESIQNINTTVQKYQEIDASLKTMIESY